MNTVFPPGSRYAAVDIATVTTADGRSIAYLRRRFLPSPRSFALLLEHTVTEGERIDTVAAEFLGDPEQSWRVCDANGAMQPEELAAPGTRLRITLPEGIGGSNDG